MRNKYLIQLMKDSSMEEIREILSGWEIILGFPEYQIYQSGDSIIHLDHLRGIKKLYNGIHLIGSIISEEGI